TRAMFGQHAVHVPMWMYVQDQGKGVVTFVGSSRSEDLRYGSDQTHQFILGELIVRPHLVMGTNTLRGSGITQLLTRNHTDIISAPDMKILADPMGKISQLLKE